MTRKPFEKIQATLFSVDVLEVMPQFRGLDVEGIDEPGIMGRKWDLKAASLYRLR
jgi:hypothetical protein